MEVKTAAGWQCRQCGAVTRRLAVHHVLPVEEARTLEEMEARCFDRGNLRVLCFDCHAMAHAGSRGREAHRLTEAGRVRRFHETDLHVDENVPRLSPRPFLEGTGGQKIGNPLALSCDKTEESGEFPAK